MMPPAQAGPESRSPSAAAVKALPELPAPVLYLVIEHPLLVPDSSHGPEAVKDICSECGLETTSLRPARDALVHLRLDSDTRYATAVLLHYAIVAQRTPASAT